MRKLKEKFMKNIVQISYLNESESKFERCGLSYNKFKKNQVIACLPCKHIFFNAAISQWVLHDSKCPTCRAHIKNTNNLIENNNDEDSE